MEKGRGDKAIVSSQMAFIPLICYHDLRPATLFPVVVAYQVRSPTNC